MLERARELDPFRVPRTDVACLPMVRSKLNSIASPRASSKAARARMKACRTRGTEPESELELSLRRRRLAFVTDHRPDSRIRRRADFVFRTGCVAVFVHGCFWHVCPRHRSWPKANAEWWRAKLTANQRRDRHTMRVLRAAGWRVVVVWEHEDMERAAARIEALLRRRRASRNSGRE